MKNNNLIGISGKIGSGKDTVGLIIQYLICLNNDTLADHQKNFNEFGLAYNSNVMQSGYEIRKFADKLKDIVCLLIGCTREQLEDQDFKNKELGEEWNRFFVINQMNDSEVKMFSTRIEAHEYIVTRENSMHIMEELRPKDVLTIKEEPLTPRLLLQLLGTECGRDIIHPNIWVNSLFADYKCMSTKRIVIIDLSKKGPESNVYGKPFEVEDNILGSYPKWIITDMRFSNELEAVKDRGGITIRVNRPLPNKTEEGFSIYYAFHPSETALDKSEFDYTIDNSGTIEDLVEKVKEILIKEKIL